MRHFALILVALAMVAGLYVCSYQAYYSAFGPRDIPGYTKGDLKR